MKPGYKTTEFWVTTLSAFATLVMTALIIAGKLSPDQADMLSPDIEVIVASISVVIVAIITSVYTISRTLVKRAETASRIEAIKLVQGE